jgi:altronate hydrolase
VPEAPSASAIRIDPTDNVAVALRDLPAGAELDFEGVTYRPPTPVSAKHKFACEDLPAGAPVRLYGVLVGATIKPVRRGEALTSENLVHRSGDFAATNVRPQWTSPDIADWREKSFLGYHRSDGAVGTANHWIVIPLVFCENRNVDMMRQALSRALGFHTASPYEAFAARLAEEFAKGTSTEDLGSLRLAENHSAYQEVERPMPNIDGVQFLTHGLGCGGTREDARALCGLLAGYVTHPNVAGATVMSLGCQNAEVALLEEEIALRSPSFDKPLLVYEQQKFTSETELLERAIRDTFVGIAAASELSRAPAPLEKLSIGVECGASDGFSGISANPAIGHCADLLVACGGKAILSEFPELCGVEQELIDRCADSSSAERFISLMKTYAARAEAVGSALHMNPSPGNIRDGLITDAIKSAGAARKGGSSPIVDVLDYPEHVTRPGLSLLCTPGNDVESTTALAGAHANLILFSTGIGTPTGNAVTPVIKVSSNTTIARRHPEMIDFDTGGIITGECSIDEAGKDLLGHCLEVASGHTRTRADLLGQYDFLPWKRGVSL